MKTIIPLLFIAFAIPMFGAGCSSAPKSQSRQNTEGLRQPPPATEPTAAPVIPKEAEKIPRPY